MTIRRTATLLLAVLSALVVFGVTAPAASAHAGLLRTTPGDAEILETGPLEVTLTFSEPVGTGLGALRVLTAKGERVDNGTVTRTAGNTVVHVPVRPGIAEGTYVVVWRVVSADSHPVSGAFTFQVGSANVDPESLLGKGDLTSLSDSPRSPSVLLGVSRLLGFAALMVLLGGAIFCLLLWPAGLGTQAVRRLLVGAAAVEFVAAGGALLLQGPYAAGLSPLQAFDGDLVRAVLDSQYGVATSFRIGLAGVALAVLLAGRGSSGRFLTGVVAALGVGCAATWSAAGHAGVGSWQPFTAVFDTTHLLTVSTWVGGLVLITVGLRGRWTPEQIAVILPRWSRLAIWSVGLLVATGVFAGLREVGNLGALFATPYGRLLLVKTTAVGLMVLLALIGRSFVRHHYPRRSRSEAAGLIGEEQVPPSRDEVAGLRRSVSLEAGLAAFVLVVTALLVNTTPAKAAFNPPYSGRSAAGPLMVQIDVYPARKGLNGVHIYTVGAGGRTVDVAEVTGTFERADGELITVSAKHKSLGHYEDLALALPAKGTWTITLQIRVNEFDSYPTTQTLEVS